MRIVIVGPAHPYRGGIADTNESLCMALNENGHDAYIVTFTVQYPEFLFPGKTQYTTDPAPKDLRIDRWMNTVNPLTWAGTARKINRLKPDLVIIRYWLPFLAPCLGTIARLLNKSIVRIAMCDNIIPHEKRIGDKLFTRYFTGSFHGFITLSQKIIGELDQFTNKPKTSFPHPINKNLGTKIDVFEARKKLGLDPNGRFLLFFGLIRAYKGLDLTIRSLAVERLKALGIRLIIAGEFYDERAPYEALIKESGLENQVTIVDQFVPTADIKTYFSAADMAIQTYITASQSGVTQLAFNFDCPILVTDVGGLSEVVEDGKLGYVCPKNEEDIASSIEDFYTKNRKLEFQEHIIKEKLKYSWNAFGDRVVELYEKVKK